MISLISLTVLLLGLEISLAQEAVAIIGGMYPDGYNDTEVEEWSHSEDCGLDIPDTPDAFAGKPGVALYEGNLFVCGGQRIGANRSSTRCDLYNMVDKVWREGPALKQDPGEVRLVTVGSNLVAVYNNGHDYVVSILQDSEWAEVFIIDEAIEVGYLELVPFNERQFFLLSYAVGLFYFVIDIETGDHMQFHLPYPNLCSVPFLHDAQLACLIRARIDEEEWRIVSVSFNEDDLSHPSVSDLGTLPSDGQLWDLQFFDLDGVMTFYSGQTGEIYYLEGDEWKLGAGLIPRLRSSVLVLPCDQ